MEVPRLIEGSSLFGSLIVAGVTAGVAAAIAVFGAVIRFAWQSSGQINDLRVTIAVLSSAVETLSATVKELTKRLTAIEES